MIRLPVAQTQIKDITQRFNQLLLEFFYALP